MFACADTLVSHRMSIFGKLVGGAAGFAMGGPLGALLGVVAGHLVDSVQAETTQGGGKPPEKNRSLLPSPSSRSGPNSPKPTAWLPPTKSAPFARSSVFPQSEIKNVGRVFQPGPPAYTWFTRPTRVRLPACFMATRSCSKICWAVCFHIAKADGTVSDEESEYIRNVADIFGFSEADFARIRAEFMGPDLADPYTILGVNADDDDATVKSAHRKLVRENHPDKLMAQGLPEEFITVANQKLGAINAAYDKINQARRGSAKT